MAIQVTYDDMTTLVYDSQLAWIGPWGDFAVYVDKAEEHSNWRCTDVPGAWYTGLVVPSGWD